MTASLWNVCFHIRGKAHGNTNAGKKLRGKVLTEKLRSTPGITKDINAICEVEEEEKKQSGRNVIVNAISWELIFTTGQT